MKIQEMLKRLNKEAELSADQIGPGSALQRLIRLGALQIQVKT